MFRVKNREFHDRVIRYISEKFSGSCINIDPPPAEAEGGVSAMADLEPHRLTVT